MASKGAFIGILAAALLAAGGYYGWKHYSQDAQAAPAQPSAQAGGAQGGGAQGGGARGAPVTLAPVTRLDVPVTLDAIGSVEATETVAVKSRIDGQILEVHFNEGDEVKAGDLLFSIDSRAIEAQIRQADANLARDRAQLANAKRNADRFRQLAQKDFVTQKNLDDAVTSAAVLESSVKANEATIENLKVQLSYTKIRAPISGRTGSVTLTKGNIVRASDTQALVTINQIRPIDVVFAVPQRYFPQVRAAMETGVAVTTNDPVDLKADLVGRVTFIDNAINSSTGTFQVKASFANDRNRLWPGMFVTVRAKLGTEGSALTVASQAVQSGQQGTFVYVARADQTVEARTVIVERNHEDRAVIGSGLKEGEQVVIDGQLRLSNGARISTGSPRPAGAPASPNAASPTAGQPAPNGNRPANASPQG